jgi:uncharacterized protein (DUF2141 family)
MEQIRNISLLLIIGITLSSFTSKKVGDGYALTLTVKELRNASGHVQFALYNKDRSIPDHDYENYFKISNGEIDGNSATVTFYDLPAGNYAVNILHDEDKDGEIDKGFVLPIEGIGFSNIQKIGLGNRPNFEKASFLLNSDKIVEIKVIYM